MMIKRKRENCKQTYTRTSKLCSDVNIVVTTIFCNLCYNIYNNINSLTNASLLLILWTYIIYELNY